MSYLKPDPKKPPREPRPRKPLRRRKPMVKRRPRRLSKAGSDPAYLAWVRTQRCCVFRICVLPGMGTYLNVLPSKVCEGEVHAHHAGRRPGIGMKADDSTAIPLCRRHHRQWHDASGVFEGLSKLERFAWSVNAIAVAQTIYAARPRAFPRAVPTR